MTMLRVHEAKAVDGVCLRLHLTNGMTVERDLSDILTGPVFEALRQDPGLFRDVRVEGGTVAWPNGAGICPDGLIWDGPSPEEDRTPPARLRIRRQEMV